MTDVQLLDFRDLGDAIDVAVVQPVAGEDDEAELARTARGCGHLVELRAPVAVPPRFRVAACVDLDLRCPDFAAVPDLLEIGIDADRDVDARLYEFPGCFLAVSSI